MSAREEFILDLKRGSLSLAEVCRRHGISRKTGHKWRARHNEEGHGGLADRSRRPKESPLRMAEEIERRVVQVRLEHPCWGGRKIREILSRSAPSGERVPAASTVTDILRRHGLLGGGTRGGAATFVRFEREEPNDLWQMDFKGHFAMAGGRRCHPLTVLDDHSRYNVILKACGGETRGLVQPLLEEAFRRYGLPRQILCDHGSPWGTGLRADGGAYGRTGLSLWLMRLGIDLIHGRPRHPQTQGKEERFHRTLAAEVLMREAVWKSLDHCQGEFDRWSRIYNQVRPHESLGMKTPGERYRLSPRSYPERMPEVESYYLAGDELRKVRSKGEITFGNRTYAVGQALVGEVVALREGAAGCREVYYCWKKLGTIDPSQATKSKGYQNRLLED
ncbi:MAG: IS481 family transposase [Verrucomicrobiaceae bacterium]|nr:MAG: IS481 family transposase [Verrucomicrobiaceae bacterium]